MSSGQISWKSLELRPRYGGFFRFFKMAAATILDFRNWKFLYDCNGQEGRTASACQILAKSLKTRLRYGHFTIFKMAAAAILDFGNFKFLMVGTVKTVKLHHHAKFRRNCSNRS